MLWPVAGAAQVASTGAPTREDIDPARRQAAPVAPTRLLLDGDIERSPCALADPAYANIKVTLARVEFNNLGPVAPEAVAGSYAELIGREVGIAALCEIRDAAATQLRRMGYLAAVQVPAQRIEGGVVRMEVLYARLTAVRVKGDAGRNEAQVARHLNKIATGQVFNRIEAERYLLLARDLPGMDVRLALKPAGTVAGEMVGEVSVRRRDVQLDFTLQNLAPSETGRLGGQLRLEAFGLTGAGDRTFASLYTTADFEEQQVLQLGHDFAIGGEGLRLGGRFTYAWTKPNLGPNLGDDAPDVRSRTMFASIEASYPIKRSQAFSLWGAAGLDIVDQDVRLAALPLSQDRVRVGWLRLDADRVDMRGRGPGGSVLYHLAGSLELRQGLSIFGASPDCLAAPVACAGITPPGLISGSPTATVLRFTGTAELRFAPQLTIALQPRGQYASGGVFGFERFALGNYTVGRGYEPGVLTGDDGAAISAELRHDPINIQTDWQLSAQPYGFVDAGWVWSRGLVGDADNPRSLVSSGAGLRVALGNRARLDVSGAVALKTAGPVQAGDVRFLMTLTTRILPWSTAK